MNRYVSSGLKTFIPALVCAFCFSWSAHAAGEKDRINLSTGVVFPSTNSALVENAARLTAADKIVEFLVEPTGGDLDLEGTVVGNTGWVGYGAGADYFGTDLIALGGLGFDAKSFALGLGLQYNIDASRLGADLGFYLGDKKGIGIGVVAKGVVGGMDALISGIGYGGDYYHLEVDMENLIDSEILYISPAASLDAGSDRVSFSLGYRIPLSNEGDGELRAGIVVWVGYQMALEYLYHSYLGDHTIGLKWALK